MPEQPHDAPFKLPLKLSDVDGRPCLIDDNNQVVAFGVWSQTSVDAVAEDVRLLGGIRDLTNAHDKLGAARKAAKEDLEDNCPNKARYILCAALAEFPCDPERLEATNHG